MIIKSIQLNKIKLILKAKMNGLNRYALTGCGQTLPFKKD